MHTFLLAILAAAPSAFAQHIFNEHPPHYNHTYTYGNTPVKSETGQTGTNQCGTDSSQTSMCQNAYVNSLDDFCLWAPPSKKSSYGDSSIANTERLEVAYCLRSGYGTRLIPAGTITGAHFITTPNYVQVTGMGDLTSMNIPKGDEGGELDPHGADGLGNPIGGLVFGDSYGKIPVIRQYHEWTNFMGATQFCFRACFDIPGATQYCGHRWDEMGCDWNMPGNYSKGFDNCLADNTDPMGMYVETIGTTTTTSLFMQGDATTPPAHPAGPTSSCTYFASLADVGAPASIPTGTLTSVSSTSTSKLSTMTTLSLTATVKPSGTLPGSGSGSGVIPTSTSSTGAGAMSARVPGSGSLGAMSALVGGAVLSFVLVLAI